MPTGTLTVVRAAPSTAPYTMAVKVDGQAAVSFVTTPPVISGTPGTWNISETERPGRQAITQASAPGLRTLHMEHIVASPRPNASIEHLLHPFRGIAETGKRVQFLGGGWLAEGTWWFVKSLDIAEDLKASNNQTSRATLTWECVEANKITAVELSKTGVKKGTVINGNTLADAKNTNGTPIITRPRNEDGTTKTGTGYTE